MTRAQRIVRQVAEAHEIGDWDVTGPRRNRRYVLARQEAMARIRGELGWSLAEVGEFFGRDHTTVLHDIRVYAARATVAA